jgi:hypothetical protein
MVVPTKRLKFNDDQSARRKAWRINVGAPITANDTVALSYSRCQVDWNSDWDMDGSAEGQGLGSELLARHEQAHQRLRNLR